MKFYDLIRSVRAYFRKEESEGERIRRLFCEGYGMPLRVSDKMASKYIGKSDKEIRVLGRIRRRADLVRVPSRWYCS